MSKHTPWTADSMGRVWGSGGRFIADCDSPEIAALVVAAPEMLEALRGLMLIHDWMVRAGGRKGPLPQDTIVKFAEMQIPAVDAAKAALAKVEGRT